MYGFKRYLIENLQLPDEILQGFENQVNSKKSSGVRTVITVRSSDRDADRDEILRRLIHAGIPASLGRSSSSVEPIDGNYEDNKFRLEIKPLQGGMAETTLNASITELFPCIAFEKKYTPTTVEDFMKYLMDIDVSNLKCVNSKDVAAAAETINKAESSSKFQEKMNNAMGIVKYLVDEGSDKSIKNVYWGYRAKPKGVPPNHPGDMFIEYNDGKYLGVSLKAGGKKTKEPQLNTYVKPIWNFFGATRDLEKLRATAYNSIYSNIEGMPDIKNYDGGSKGRHKDRRKTEDALINYEKENSRGYEEDYNRMLEIMRQGVVSLFNKNKGRTLAYIKAEILRDAPEVPTIVIKAVGSDYEEVTDRDELGVFLPQVQFIKASSSTRSKQNWTLELTSGDENIKMAMSIRSNKSGNAGKRKLGQFPTGLAIKYNGIIK